MMKNDVYNTEVCGYITISETLTTMSIPFGVQMQ
jgi:hypothetical protein